ncbi:MAG: response regulator [Chromatiales bacterium]|nr:response regulator [Chromatiales bacterium]
MTNPSSKNRRVLVVDDLAVMRLLVRNNLRSMGIEHVALAANGREALEMLQKWRFDIVVTDWNMPLMDGLELLKYIRASKTYRHIPVVLITAEGERAQVRHAIEAGVTEFLIKPFSFGAFQRKIQRVIDRLGTPSAGTRPDQTPQLTAMPQSFEAEPDSDAATAPAVSSAKPDVMDAVATILAVDDMPDTIHLITGILKDDYRVKGAKNGEQALRIARSDDPPHLILLDIMMPDMDGIEVCRRLKADARTRDIPIIFLTAKIDAQDVIAGLDLGAVDYVTKPTNPSVLKARIRTHLRLGRQRNELLEQRAMALENARLREEIERMTRHDIKNPLNALLALAQDLATGDNLLPAQRETLASMEESARYVLDLIDHSQALYHMESGTYPLEPVDLDLSALLARVVAETRAAFGALNIHVHQVAPVPVRVRGEELLCHTLFSNLIRNAAEASPAGYEISIEIETDPDGVSVHIYNDGAVPEPIRDTFFDKYVTHGKTRGTGIGTYSAKLMTETQGGRIAMRTSEEAGTQITVTLPAAQPANGRVTDD